LLPFWAVCLVPVSAPADEPVDVLAFFNAAEASEAELLDGFDPAGRVHLNRVALHGWGFPSLVREPSPRPGVLAAFEDAAPLGFSRADVDAAVAIAVKQLPEGRGVLSGVLEPIGLKFRREVRPDAAGQIRVPIPAACMAPGDYVLKLCLRAGGRVEWAELPLVVGPYLQRDRFHTYSWNAGGSNEADLARQIELARRAGVDVLDTAYLPAITALKEGLFISAHYVTLYQGDVADGYAAVAPYPDMARAQAEAIGEMARRYRHLLWCILNSEYGSDRMLRSPAYEAAMRREIGCGFDDLDISTLDSPIPGKTLLQVSPGVYPHGLPELAAHRFARRHGMGWFELNRQSMEVMRQRAPWLTLWTDPVFTNEQFEGFDAVGFWHYENDPYQTVALTQRAECARRLSGAREVFLTLSQWYSGVAADGGWGWGLRSPDHHRFNGWLALTLPVHALGYWELGELPDNPDCAAGLRDSLRRVVYPFGTLLTGTVIPSPPVALYVSTAGEFLSRANRPHNFWFQTHYLNGVVPALLERFRGQVDWVDDEDVLAGRLARYKLVLCPLFAATTDLLLTKLKEYQAGGGLLAGDELWGVSDLVPSLRFPGRSTDTLGLPYANESLPQWHRANRDAIRQWQPPELPPLSELLEVSTSTPDAFAALREFQDVRFAVVANGRFRRGEFARRHGYAEGYLDEGVAQETDLLVKAPATSVVYDVVHSRRLDSTEYTVVGDKLRISLVLEPAGGAILAFHPRPIAGVRVSPGLRRTVTPGLIVPLTITVLDDRGAPIAGTTAVRVQVRDARGRDQDVSGVHQAPRGTVRLPFGVPLDAEPGRWAVEVRDLTSGLEDRADLIVAPRSSRAIAPGQ
jgi:hypothetical protein